MATNLFKQYYNNPAKQYIYADINCPGSGSADDSQFSIEDGKATITDSDGNTSVVDLNDVVSGVDGFNNQSVTLQPNSVNVFRGLSMGEFNMTRCFGYISDDILNIKQWKYLSGLSFDIRYRYKGRVCSYRITACAEFPDDIETAVQKKIDAYNIPLSIYFVDNYIMFIAKELGFEYYIDNVDLQVDPEYYTDNDPDVVEKYEVLTEIESMYVPAIKYKNGAFKGVVIKPVYPKYNDDAITPEMRSLKIAFVKDRIFNYEPLISESDNIVYKNLVDVDIDYRNTAEYNAMKWRFPHAIDCDTCEDDNGTNFVEWRPSKPHHHHHRNEENQEENPRDNNDNNGWIDQQVEFRDYDDEWYEPLNNTKTIFSDEKTITIQIDPNEHIKRIIGIYGYASYVEANDGWLPVGSIFMDIAAEDSDYTRNLIPSFILYNPNDYPLEAKIMTFV